MSAGQVGHVIAAVACGYFVLASYRYVARRSAVVGAILAAAILARIALGLALFWVSYLELPIAESVQVSGGFWQPALDATGYYQLASDAAAAHAPFDLEYGVPSPSFVKALALWMLVVGISPAAGLFLNLCLYALLVVLVVRFFEPVNDWRHDLPCAVGVSAYSFAPVILLHSTQPLKDELSNLLITIACLGVLALRRLIYGPSATRHSWAVVAGALAVSVAVFASGGIRWYYGFVLSSALTLVLGIFAIRGRTTSLPRYLAGSLAVVTAVWLGFSASVPNNLLVLRPDLASVLDFPSHLARVVNLTRIGFLTSGGGTNVVVPLQQDPAAGKARLEELAEATRAWNERQAGRHPGSTGAERARAAARSAADRRAGRTTAPPSAAAPAVQNGEDLALWALGIPVNIPDQLITLATGVVIILVPFSLVEAVSGLQISGGRGLLWLADLDTIFLDIASLSVLVLLWRRRQVIGDRLPLVVFGLILSGVTAVLLGYVVTNFGTLWRMRPMFTVPLWVLVVALTPRARVSSEAARAHEPDSIASDMIVAGSATGHR